MHICIRSETSTIFGSENKRDAAASGGRERRHHVFTRERANELSDLRQAKSQQETDMIESICTRLRKSMWRTSALLSSSFRT